VWLLALFFLPGFSCYELGPEPRLGPTLQAGYLPVVGLKNDVDDVKPGYGFVLGGGVGTRRGGELVMPDEYRSSPPARRSSPRCSAAARGGTSWGATSRTGPLEAPSP
jgi:hypothetical protein